MNTILQSLKSRGYRITKIRSGIIDILYNTRKPLTVMEIKSALEQHSLKPNKSTIYREVSALKSEGIVHEILHGDAKVHYKICPSYNHIHLVCVKCHSVDEIRIGSLSRYNKLALQQKGFEGVGYGIELFGICKKCKQSNKEAAHETNA
ncbi:MAG: Fur family transcriptional regulator [bacterium]